METEKCKLEIKSSGIAATGITEGDTYLTGKDTAVLTSNTVGPKAADSGRDALTKIPAEKVKEAKL